ncbi:MAG TPA: PRC-barrel domain-containing protein [Trebonia sp.]|nr:PRC-barrel domain-containing protein [Trebonia sp.]
MQFTIGGHASLSDGTHCRITRVIVDPVKQTITHLVVEPGHRASLSRLVPLDLVESSGGQVRLHCTEAELERLDPAEEVKFLPGTAPFPGYSPGQVGFWPYYSLGINGRVGGEVTEGLTADVVPPGEVDVQRGDPVQATDGDIGKVQGLVVDPGSHRVTHVLLQEGHLWGRHQVAIPMQAVASTEAGIRLNLTKRQVEDLPPVDARHPLEASGS